MPELTPPQALEWYYVIHSSQRKIVEIAIVLICSSLRRCRLGTGFPTTVVPLSFFKE
jgi:hypothetical protein